MPIEMFSGIHFVMAGSSPQNTAFVANEPIYYGVQYNHSGKLWLRVDKKYEYKVEGPYAFITHPGSYFEYGPVDGETRHHNYVCFYGSNVERLIDGGLMVPGKIPHLTEITHADTFLQTIQKIINIVFAQKYNNDRAVLTLEDLLLQLHEQQSNVSPKRHQTPYLTALLSEIRMHPHKNIDWQEAAEEMNLSLVHFRRLFKQCCGMTPQQFIIQQRLIKATELLVNTSELIRDISRMVGIDNEFYFSRLFKKKYKISPERYRIEFAGF